MLHNGPRVQVSPTSAASAINKRQAKNNSSPAYFDFEPPGDDACGDLLHTGLTSSVRNKGPSKLSGLSDRMNAGTSSALTHAKLSAGSLPMMGAIKPVTPPRSTWILKR